MIRSSMAAFFWVGVEGTLRVFVLPDVLGHLALGLVGVVDLARVAGGAPVDEAVGVEF